MSTSTSLFVKTIGGIPTVRYAMARSGPEPCRREYSGEKDYSIGSYGRNGVTNAGGPDEGNYSPKDVARTGLTFRRPLL